LQAHVESSASTGTKKKATAAVFVGFDSAWADNPKAPGAICSVVFDGDRFVDFRHPESVGFQQALTHIERVRRLDLPTLIAIDQPTIVPNDKGMRPVDRAAASLISWMGGGVQPANRGKLAMFGPQAPIWAFMERLAATQDPEIARTATEGVHLMEVFPALALASFSPKFFGRLMGPRYNPARRKTFRRDDWRAVILSAITEARRYGFHAMVGWLDELHMWEKPSKMHQDRLDAAICLLVAIRWRVGARDESVVLGDLQSGYMLAPVSSAVMTRLSHDALARGVPVNATGDSGRGP
jgi:predicted RNase H-like nuclease